MKKSAPVLLKYSLTAPIKLFQRQSFRKYFTTASTRNSKAVLNIKIHQDLSLMEGLINVALLLIWCLNNVKGIPVKIIKKYFIAINTQMKERWFSASTSWLSARLSAVWNKTFTRLRTSTILIRHQRQLVKTKRAFKLLHYLHAI